MKVLLVCLLAWAGAAAAADNCAPWGEVRFVCGPTGAEDLLRIGNTPWLIASGLAETNVPGRLHLIDTATKRWEVAYPSSQSRNDADRRRFPNCATPPDAAKFSAHGMAIRPLGNNEHELLVVNHGGREAIEFFNIQPGGMRPVLQWQGCVTMPEDVYPNSVAYLPDGGFIATQFYLHSKGINSVFLRQVTGGLLEWHPGGLVTRIAGTEVSGANGILVSRGGKVIYVSAWGTRELVRFDRSGAALTKKVVPLTFAADNLRWAPDGKIIAAGQKFVARTDRSPDLEGWTIARIDPDSLAVTTVFDTDARAPMQGVSVAIEVNGNYWFGPFRGERVGYMPAPRDK
jgi:SMP-30/Gluconolactonase/LRE-like region